MSTIKNDDYFKDCIFFTMSMNVAARLAAPAAAGLVSPYGPSEYMPLQESASGEADALVPTVRLDSPSTDVVTTLRRRLTPLGRTSLLTELDSNRSVPMFLLRVRWNCVFKTLLSCLEGVMEISFMSADTFPTVFFIFLLRGMFFVLVAGGRCGVKIWWSS